MHPARSARANLCCSATPSGWRSSAALAGCGEADRPRVEGGTADAGKLAIQRHGCVSCHAVPGIPGLASNVGPPLKAMGRRGYLAGVIANTPENLVRWIRHPTGIDPLFIDLVERWPGRARWFS